MARSILWNAGVFRWDELEIPAGAFETPDEGYFLVVRKKFENEITMRPVDVAGIDVVILSVQSVPSFETPFLHVTQTVSGMITDGGNNHLLMMDWHDLMDETFVRRIGLPDELTFTSVMEAIVSIGVPKTADDLRRVVAGAIQRYQPGLTFAVTTIHSAIWLA
jgi:hypothetical protein